MGALRNISAAAVIGVIIVAQVILPATVDLILSLALVAAGAWIGWKTAQTTA